MAIVFAIPNRALRDIQKTKDLQREQVLKKDERTDAQRESEITEYLGPMGERQCNKESDHIFMLDDCQLSSIPLFSLLPHI